MINNYNIYKKYKNIKYKYIILNSKNLKKFKIYFSLKSKLMANYIILICLISKKSMSIIFSKKNLDNQK